MMIVLFFTGLCNLITTIFVLVIAHVLLKAHPFISKRISGERIMGHIKSEYRIICQELLTSFLSIIILQLFCVIPYSCSLYHIKWWIIFLFCYYHYVETQNMEKMCVVKLVSIVKISNKITTVFEIFFV